MRNPDRPLTGRNTFLPTVNEDDGRQKTNKITSPERWEIKQMIAAGSLDKRTLADIDDEVSKM